MISQQREQLAAPSLVLSSASLLSRFGFNDGDIPESLLDYWHSIEVDYLKIDWHSALRKLVHEHLLPQLEKTHTIVVYIETCHNPIRAESVDGVTVVGSGEYIALEPIVVTVPYSAVAEACGL